MGFGTIVASVVMFIAVLTLSTSVFIAMKNDISLQTDAMREQSKALANNINTDIRIENLGYDNVTNTTVAGIRNVGKTKLSLDHVDLYIDIDYIPRNDTSRLLYIDPSTDTRNIGIWDPNELVIVQVFKDLPKGERVFKITVQYSVSDEDVFSVAYT